MLCPIGPPFLSRENAKFFACSFSLFHYISISALNLPAATASAAGYAIPAMPLPAPTIPHPL